MLLDFFRAITSSLEEEIIRSCAACSDDTIFFYLSLFYEIQSFFQK